MANNLMSISEMIHLSFGASNSNVVNFKLIQAVLYLLARQLRVLERQVEVKEAIFDSNATSTKLSVTEVKISATVSKKKRKSTHEFSQKIEKSSTSTKPGPSTDDDESDKTSKYKESTQKSSSVIHSELHHEEKSRHTHTEFLHTPDKTTTYEPQESSEDFHSTADALSKLISSKSSDRSVSDEQYNAMCANIQATVGDEYARATMALRKKISLRDDPISRPYFAKIIKHHPQKLSEQKSKECVDHATVAYSYTDVAIMPKKSPTTMTSSGSTLPSKARSKALVTKSYDETETLSMHDVLQQFHSFKSSVGSSQKSSIDKRPRKKYSLPSLQDTSINAFSTESSVHVHEKTSFPKHMAPKLVYDVATVTDVPKEDQCTDDINEQLTPKAIEVTSFKLPTIDSTHSFTMSLNEDDDNIVESTFNKLRGDPIAMPYFRKKVSANIEAEKKSKVKKSEYKKSREEYVKVKFTEHYEVFPKPIGKESVKALHDITESSRHSAREAETSAPTSVKLPNDEEISPNITKLLVTEDPISMPYFIKSKPSKDILNMNVYTTKGKKTRATQSNKMSISKATKSSLTISKETSQKTTITISNKTPEHVESEENIPKYTQKRPSLFVNVDDEHKPSSKDITLKLQSTIRVSSRETKADQLKDASVKSSKKDFGSKTSITGSTSSKISLKSKSQHTSRTMSSSSLDTPSKKPSLYEEAVAAAQRLSLQEEERSKIPTDGTPESTRRISFQEDKGKKTVYTEETKVRDDLLSHTSQSSFVSAVKSSTSESVASRKDFEASSLEHTDAKSTEKLKDDDDAAVIEQTLSPLHSDQSFVVRPAGPYGKPLDWEESSQAEKGKTVRRKLVRRAIVRNQEGSIIRKGRKANSAGSSTSIENEYFEGEAYEIEYEEVKDDGGSSDTSSFTSKKGFFQTWSDAEMQREKELRVINQRADSHEEPDMEPMPMALVTSKTEVKQEKLLILERKSSKDETEKRSSSQEPTHRLSIVTMEEFLKLKEEFIALRNQFAGLLELPENSEFMNQLRNGATLSEAIASLRLSARLEATEKAVVFLSGIVTELCKGKGVNIEDGKAVVKGGKKAELAAEEEEQDMIDRGISVLFAPRARGPHSLEDDQFVTYEELDEAMDHLEKQMNKTIHLLQKKSDENSKRAVNMSLKLQEQLGEALNLGNRMEELYDLVLKYSTRVTDMDMGIASQMASYQDQLTQMQFDLESTMDSVAEAIASSGADPELIKELRIKLMALQQHVENGLSEQKEMQQALHSMVLDLEELWKQIENLRATKCDHEELQDGLHDKVDIALLNRMVHQDQYDATIQEIYQKISAAYNKFDAQERHWQEAIEDFTNCLNDKADFNQVSNLRTYLQSHLVTIVAKIKNLAAIVGEAPAGAVSRQLLRDTKCLSCRLPVMLSQEKSGIPKLPALSRPPTIGAEAVAESGDGLCYPGQPIPHALDPRAKLCRRYCGGRAPGERRPLMKINTKPLSKDQTTHIGTDGNVYLADESATVTKPCLQCNYNLAVPEKLHAQEEQGISKSTKDSVSDTSPKTDYWNLSYEFAGNMLMNSVSNTMPLNDDDDD